MLELSIDTRDWIDRDDDQQDAKQERHHPDKQPTGDKETPTEDNPWELWIDYGGEG